MTEGSTNGKNPNPLQLKIATIQQAILHLTELDQVIEVRIPDLRGRKRTDAGYFNDPERLAKAVIPYDGKAKGIYFTLNPVHPDLMARANNRIIEYAEHLTVDPNILNLANLPIDIDPVRLADISSNDAEHEVAIARANAIRDWLI